MVDLSGCGYADLCCVARSVGMSVCICADGNECAVYMCASECVGVDRWVWVYMWGWMCVGGYMWEWVGGFMFGCVHGCVCVGVSVGVAWSGERLNMDLGG